MPFWLTGAVLKQGPVTFLLLVPVAVAVYLASWTGWLVTDGGYYRHWADEAGQRAHRVLLLGAAGLAEPLALPPSAYTYHVGVHARTRRSRIR